MVGTTRSKVICLFFADCGVEQGGVEVSDEESLF